MLSSHMKNLSQTVISQYQNRCWHFGYPATIVLQIGPKKHSIQSSEQHVDVVGGGGEFRSAYMILFVTNFTQDLIHSSST
jgi:hypothetical protein